MIASTWCYHFREKADRICFGYVDLVPLKCGHYALNFAPSEVTLHVQILSDFIKPKKIV